MTRYLALALVLGASLAQAQTPATATASLQNTQGGSIGTATFRQTPTGVLMKVDLKGLPPGVHALHLHTTGKCEAPMFTSAGGHFAPGGTKHGLMAPMGPHAGDLPNAYVAADGTLQLEVLAKGVNLTGDNALLDADGAAIVVHATADDYMTDPAGNAGGRIACGVLTAQ